MRFFKLLVEDRIEGRRPVSSGSEGRVHEDGVAFAPNREVTAGEWTEIEVDEWAARRDTTHQAIELSAPLRPPVK